MVESNNFKELSDSELLNVLDGLSYDANGNVYNITISQYNYYSCNGNIL